MLDNEYTIPGIASELNLKADTLRKAVSSGKLHKPQKKLLPTELPATTSKSERSRIDASSPIGMGATNTFGRLEASLFQQGPVDRKFVPCLDVPNGEELLAIPDGFAKSAQPVSG